VHGDGLDSGGSEAELAGIDDPAGKGGERQERPGGLVAELHQAVRLLDRTAGQATRQTSLLGCHTGSEQGAGLEGPGPLPGLTQPEAWRGVSDEVGSDPRRLLPVDEEVEAAVGGGGGGYR